MLVGLPGRALKRAPDGLGNFPGGGFRTEPPGARGRRVCERRRSRYHPLCALGQAAFGDLDQGMFFDRPAYRFASLHIVFEDRTVDPMGYQADGTAGFHDPRQFRRNARGVAILETELADGRIELPVQKGKFFHGDAGLDPGSRRRRGNLGRKIHADQLQIWPFLQQPTHHPPVARRKIEDMAALGKLRRKLAPDLSLRRFDPSPAVGQAAATARMMRGGRIVGPEIIPGVVMVVGHGQVLMVWISNATVMRCPAAKGRVP